MRLIVGGSWQGKREAALALTGLGPEMVTDGAVCSLEDLGRARILDHFHLLVKRAADAEKADDAPQKRLPREEISHGAGPEPFGLAQLEEALEEMLSGNPGLTVISDELGCGVVPVDRQDRLWREKTGRLLCRIAGQADEVYRVSAGIAVRIKPLHPESGA